MNKLFGLVLVMLVFLTGDAYAQTVDEIINNNIEAKGGLEKINSVHSLVFTGTATNRGNIINIQLMYEHDKAMRTEFSIGNIQAYTILTRKEGWRFSSQDTNGVVPLKDWEVTDGQFQLDIHGVYVEYRKKGYEATYLGKDTALGKNCDKIKLVKKGEGDKIYFFDEDRMLIKSIIERMTAPGKYTANVTYYLDYKKNEDGLLFSYTRKAGNETISFTNITGNAFLPDVYFRPY